MFAQLKVTEDAVSKIRSSFNNAVATGETCYTATDGGMGEAFFKLTKTINLLIENQEKVLSTVVDAVGLLATPTLRTPPLPPRNKVTTVPPRALMPSRLLTRGNRR